MNPVLQQILATLGMALATAVVGVAGAALERHFGKSSVAVQLATLFATSIAEQGHGATQMAVIAKAGLVGLEDHPLVQHATDGATASPADPGKN